MKRITLLMLFFSAVYGYSQVKGYTFASSEGTYTPITGGTALGTETSDAQNFIDPTVVAGTTATAGAGIPIGFDFTFNGQTYDRFGISNDGWISLGSSTLATAVDMKVTGAFLPLSSVAATANELNAARIAALSGNLQGQTGSAIRFLTIGNEGSKVLVVQWENYKRAGANATGDSFNFQIRLSQTSNTVQIVYGNFNTNPSLNTDFQVGLRAEPSTVASNFVNRTLSADWGNTAEGILATDKISINGTTKPASQLTYTWTPPTCGAAKALLTSTTTLNSATFTWSSYIPASDGYQYVVSASATLPTGAGTSATSASGSASNLDPNTSYKVFVRTYCGSQFTPWVLVGSFKTKCADAAEFFEDFDAYAPLTPVADCWDKVVTPNTPAIARIAAKDGSNRLHLNSNTGALPVPTMAAAVMPAVTNLQAGNHRLRFKAMGVSANGSGEKWLDLGYYDGNGNFVTGQVIQNLPTTAATMKEYIVDPATWTPAVPATVKNLVFRNSNNTLADLYIDNVSWEPIPPACAADVKSPMDAKQITHNTAVLTWTAGGAETAWQYVYAPASATNPYVLTGSDVPGTSPTVSLSGLLPATKYKAWIRSKCADGSLGAWIGPVLFTTNCAQATEVFETFDGQSSLVIPSCWSKVGSVGAPGIGTSSIPAIPSGGYYMTLNGGYASNPYSIVALPPVSNAGAGSHRLKFKAATNTSAIGNQLVIGWIGDVANADSFHELATIADLSTTAFQSYEFTFGTLPNSPYLAFKNPGNVASSIVKIDDVIWEPIPTCPNLQAISAELVTTDSAKLKWTSGGSESAWQYVMTSGAETNPNALSALNVPTPTVTDITVSTTLTGLTPNTAYKVWLRSKCPNNVLGSWNGPLLVTTPCSPITHFTQNFDSALSMPSCWAQAGKTGEVGVHTPSPAALSIPSAPYILTMASSAITGVGVVAMPAVSNIAAGTHKLSFKYQSNVAGAKIDVGYLKNMADSASFVSILAAPLNCTAEFQSASLDFGTDAAPEGVQVLAFKNMGAVNGSIYVDDVTWLPANGIAPPVNDEPAGAIFLTVGQDFGSSSISETNLGATNSVQPSPGCGGYNGKDVWNAAVVPASGKITFEINTIAGGITNTAAAVYSGSLSSLALVACNDSGSTAGDDHPKISLTGRTPGEVLYLRVWENGGNASGSFYVSAYDSNPLGADVFEANNFAYYPNPVTDILNLSLNQEIANVAVFNLLGQQVINQPANGNQARIDMSGLTEGAYLVRVFSNDQSKTIKVIKE